MREKGKPLKRPISEVGECSQCSEDDHSEVEVTTGRNISDDDITEVPADVHANEVGADVHGDDSSSIKNPIPSADLDAPNPDVVECRMPLKIQYSGSVAKYKIAAVPVLEYTGQTLQLTEGSCILIIRESLKEYVLCYEIPHEDDFHKQMTKVSVSSEVPISVLSSIARTKCCDAELNVAETPWRLEFFLNKRLFCDVDTGNIHASKEWKADLKQVLTHFCGFQFRDYPEKCVPYDPAVLEQLYENLYNVKRESLTELPDLSRVFRANLRPYQSMAVKWMLHNEKLVLGENEKILLPSFEEYETMDGLKVYFHKYGLFFTEKRFTCSPTIHGGILADEMGLGKTVEVLALILSNPRHQQVENISPKIFDDLKQSQSTKELWSENTPIDNGNGIFLCVCSSSKYRKKTVVTCSKCTVSQHLECIFGKGASVPEVYVCPYCSIEETVVSRATLIVTPASISYQWEKEIERHCTEGALSVFLYKGTGSKKFVPPCVLADNDIVITTYEVLRHEAFCTGLQHVIAQYSHSRHPKKYMVLPSPLTAVEWYRVCLDEAQMVEASATKTAEMALQLKAINRWCVTGTPVQRSIEDLYGLFSFLDYKPYSEKKCWRELLCKPFIYSDYYPMLEAMKPIFWRTLKKHVSEQINIPHQIVASHKLLFSPIEKYFYDKQHEMCSHDFSLKVSNLQSEMQLKLVDRKMLPKILAPLKRLRLACCHPQAVKGHFVPLDKSIMSMEEIAESLMKKAETECEEVNRELISSINGLAGVHIIEKKLLESAKLYALVLKSVEMYLPLFRTDQLQQLHALHNMLEVLAVQKISDNACNPVVADIPENETEEKNRDERLECLELPEEYKTVEGIQAKVSNISLTYLSRHTTLVSDAEKELTSRTSEVVSLKEKCSTFALHPWWHTVISKARDLGRGEELLHWAKSIINDPEAAVFRRWKDNMCTLNGLVFICTTALDELLNSRNEVTKAVLLLKSPPSADEINACIDCHLRPFGGKVQKCPFCTCGFKFDDYEEKLFNVSVKKSCRKRRVADSASGTQTEEEPVNKRTGTWANGAVEQLLRLIFNFSRSIKGSEGISKDGSTTFELFEAMKKEFKALRLLWSRKHDHVSAVDELEMAKMRLRLCLPDEEVPKGGLPHIINEWDIAYRKNELQEQKERSQNLLKVKIGRLLYLKNVVKACSSNSGEDAEICPICQQNLKSNWCCFLCGHRICVDCLDVFMNSKRTGHVKSRSQCPICREYTNIKDILIAGTGTANISPSTVKGKYSTKVTGIVDCLMKIRAEDSAVKIIVFSSCSITHKNMPVVDALIQSNRDVSIRSFAAQLNISTGTVQRHIRNGEFDDILNVIAEALNENEIPHVNALKRKDFNLKVEEFKAGEKSVLLLPLRTGANGLNITEATNAIFVEPILNKAKMQQAVGRIHRIGQEKETFVHRFFIGETIEERVTNFTQFDHVVSAREDVEKLATIRDIKALFLGF